MNLKLLCLCFALSPAIALHAQNMPVPSAVPAAVPTIPPCEGTYVIVRQSLVKPGMMPNFLAASAANLKWYRDKGFKSNQLVVSRVVERNAETGNFAYSDTHVMTYHYNPPSLKSRVIKDAGYDAFVKMYEDSSDITSEQMVCMPKVKI